MTTKSYLFHDILKAPGYLSQFDVARLRKLANEATEQDFREAFSCDPDDAKRILFFWEIAQIELWDAEILKHFFHTWIYENRELVARRIQAAQINGRLPERFTPEMGLQWLESENVLMGMIPHWVRFNARVRAGGVLDTTGAGVSDVSHVAVAQPAQSPQPQAWQVFKPQRFSGYAAPLHKLLSEAHRTDKPRPTARDVLEAWRMNKPLEIAQVLQDSIDYYDSKGDTETANTKALQKAIDRMTKAR